jgi:hypothetical protein
VGEKPQRAFRAISAAALVSALLALTASPSRAAVAIGFIDQFGPAPPALCINPDPIDLVEATGPAAPSFTVPAIAGQSLVITSWSHHASAGSAPLEFKVYRPVGGSTYRVIAHDGPRPLSSGAVNTFSGLHIPVLPGDVIGLHTAGAPSACHFNALGESYLYRSGDLADGQQGDFLLNNGELLNVSALVAADNRFALSGVERNKKRGTARITLDLPNPGSLFLSGKQIRVLGGPRNLQVNAGPVSFVVGAAPAAKTKLLAKGKLRVEVQVVYAPTGGDGTTQKLIVKLRKRLG